ncbi:MAG: hypothetical protein Q8P64_24835 [Deltaproteobacteria bacterium]|nr:hypothetical protein [Deltaproteobacteria bacterium]
MSSLVSVFDAVDQSRADGDQVKPRRNRVYLQGLLSYEKPDLEAVVSWFRDWSSHDEYLILRKDSGLEAGLEFKAVKMAKRGNSVYSYRVEERLRGLDAVPDLKWFNPRDRSSRHQTSALFVTLTYERTDLRVDEAWERIGEDYNRFISAMRARYGKIQHFRTWEAQKAGYPHIHAVLYFEEQSFEAFYYGDAWRVQEKHDLESLWPHGFIDVEALASLRGGIGYVAKYLSKVHRALGQEGAEGAPHGEGQGLGGLISRASVLTMALASAMGRRAFSVSKGLFDLTTDLRNSNSVQVDLEGNPVFRWVLTGFWSGNLGRWVRTLSRAEYGALKGSPGWTDRCL